MQKPEGAGRGYLPQVISVGKIDFEGFPSDQRVWEVHCVRHRISVRGIYRDEFIALPQLQGPEDFEVLARTPLLTDTHPMDGFHERASAAVENREFEIIQFHDRIVDPRAHKCREQMLRGRDQHAFFHQAGCVAHASNIAANGFYFEIVQIGAAEDYSASRLSRQDPHAHRGATMQADAAELRGCTYCLFLNQ